MVDLHAAFVKFKLLVASVAAQNAFAKEISSVHLKHAFVSKMSGQRLLIGQVRDPVVTFLVLTVQLSGVFLYLYDFFDYLLSTIT